MEVKAWKKKVKGEKRERNEKKAAKAQEKEDVKG